MTEPTAKEIVEQFYRWTSEHSRQAVSQGYDMFDYDCSGMLQLQRSDEEGVFATDDEAISFVKGLAERGDETAKLALELDAYFEPLIYQERQHELDEQLKPTIF